MNRAAVVQSETFTEVQPVKKPRKARRKLVWVVGSVVFLLMAIAIMLPSLCQAREPANRVKCASNLRQIGQAIVLFASAHGGQYPPSLAAMMAEEDLAAETVVCPSSSEMKSQAADTAGVVADIKAAETNAEGHKFCVSYVYVGRGLTTQTATNQTVVAYEPLTNHDEDGTNVLFGDGHAEFIGKRDWPGVAARGGVPLPATPTKS